MDKIILLVEANPDDGRAQFIEAMRHLGLYWLIINEPPPMRGTP